MVRVSGSHHVMKHPDGRAVPVPVHADRDMLMGTLRNMLAIVDLTEDDLRKLLQQRPLVSTFNLIIINCHSSVHDPVLLPA